MPLIPDPKVARDRYGVCLRTLDRWDNTPNLNFPKPRYINKRKFRDSDELDAWDRNPARRVRVAADDTLSKTPVLANVEE